MIKSPLTTPILFLIFNRPDITEKVFNEIRKAKPTRLFIASDGPRENNINDQKLCYLTKKIVKKVDWKCQVFTNFRDKNLGCKLAVSSAINWFFKNVEAGIILEDDCLPNQSFFWFCQELLERYKNDERIMMISGSCLPINQTKRKVSYYFSKIAGIWGWATWRRAWKHYDSYPKDFKKFIIQEQIKNIFNDRVTRSFWVAKISQAIKGGKSWAFLWAYTLLKQNGLCICPTDNLVSNIGFGSDASNAKHQNSVFAKLRTKQINKIIHPTFIVPNMNADRLGTIAAAKEQMPTLFLTKKIIHKILPMITHIIPNTWRKNVVKIWKS